MEDLGKRKVASRFVPHAFSDDQRHEHVQYAKNIIKTARRNRNYLNSIVAEDETCVFALIPQLNAKVLNGRHQHHQKAKKFVFKSKKCRQCLCVATTARELFTTILSLRDKLSLEVFI